jgi:hypothetical protein
MAAEGAVTRTGRAQADLPYRPSWVDYLIHAIDRLPIPAWAFYVLLLAGLLLFVNAVDWIGGLYRPGTINPAQSGYAVYIVYMLAMMHYLNRVARSKLAAFRPALDMDEPAYLRLRHQLTTLPAREAALAGLVGLGFVVFLYASEVPGSGMATMSPAFLVGRFLIEGSTFALLAVLIYHTIHQLRLVSRIHAMASRIDLFEPAPLYAFSHLTARTGIGLVVLTVFSFIVDPSINVLGVALTALVLVVAAGAFVLPLEGMHSRIVVEKYRLQLEANRRMKATLSQLHRSVDEGDLSRADGLNKTLESLQLERDAIAKMPTWPWEPGTLRGFSAALLVPIVLWLIIRGLERFV